jgi:7-keto-8-aminopelargonate synthetase-like enzyme
MSTSKYQRYLDIVERIVVEGTQKGVCHLTLEDEGLQGRTIQVRGREVVNFGSASYLGLELDKRLIDGAIEAAQKFGTQYSSSRAYVSSGQYPVLERLLGEIFEAQVLVTPSTTLAHLTALPILIHEKDAIVLDQQVHASVQMAVELVKSRGPRVISLEHNRIDRLVKKVRELETECRRIWYMADGVYSMHGDLAPLAELVELLEQFEKLYLYVDDAHGMSWIGKHGRGHALHSVSLHPKMVVATSLNKGFAAAGGALVLPNPAWHRRVRACGLPLIFSGPIQPPMLGAAIASARLHLSDEITDLQSGLRQRIEHCNKMMKKYDLPLAAETMTPIFFVRVGLPTVGSNLVQRLLNEGFYVNVGVFPAVPLTETGLRFTVTLHHELEDIEQLAAATAHHLPRAIKDESSIRSIGHLVRMARQET